MLGARLAWNEGGTLRQPVSKGRDARFWRSDWVAACMLRRVEPKLNEIEVKDNG
jgi:hypothetical protein